MRPNRRKLLTAAGTALVTTVAGCSGEDSDGDTPTATGTGTPTSTPGDAAAGGIAEGTPEDADHVVDMNAAAYEPDELTVTRGETVAWVHSGGEPHSVTADGDGIPAAATYWASGGFDSERAAREGWSDGEGVVESGHYYTRTFETTGTHEYVCIPHESVGMDGSITVE